jgi:hypothetical protein
VVKIRLLCVPTRDLSHSISRTALGGSGFSSIQFDEDVADAAFVSDAALADEAMARGAALFKPFSAAGAEVLRANGERVFQAYYQMYLCTASCRSFRS